MTHPKDVVFQLIGIIEQDIGKNLSMDKLSELSGYSKWYFQRLFYKYVAMNVGSYIRYRKLSTAAIMLKQCKITISELAAILGFSSHQSFTRSFQKFMGETPHKFRMNPICDFSKLLPPLCEDAVLNYKFISIPYCDYILEDYSFFLYQPLDKERLRRMKSKTCDLIPFEKHCNKVIQSSSVAVRMNEQPIQCFNRLEGVSFPFGKYLLITYRGSFSGYYDFFNDVYNSHLPKIGVKVRSGLIVELYRKAVLSGNEIDIGVLIYLEGEPNADD
jgi:AraC family transcriptional activator of mar-sox-rob regulon